MPTYGYRCVKNGHEFEIVQGINDPPLQRCIHCGSKVNRIFYPVGIVFKGQGFYKTDSRGSSSASASVGGAKGKETKDTKESKEKPGGDSAAKPAEAKKAGSAKKET
jgi:putative FmdB family regulatory protein